MPATDVVIVSRVRVQRTVSLDCEHPETVMLDLEQPIIVVERVADSLTISSETGETKALGHASTIAEQRQQRSLVFACLRRSVRLESKPAGHTMLLLPKDAIHPQFKSAG